MIRDREAAIGTQADIDPIVPPRVDYELTRLGRSLLEPVNGLSLWARQHRAAIADARGRFDAAQGKP